MAQQAIILVLVLLNIAALYDILRRPVDVGSKLLWSLLVVLFPFVGLILYAIIGRSDLTRNERTGESHY